SVLAAASVASTSSMGNHRSLSRDGRVWFHGLPLLNDSGLESVTVVTRVSVTGASHECAFSSEARCSGPQVVRARGCAARKRRSGDADAYPGEGVPILRQGYAPHQESNARAGRGEAGISPPSAGSPYRLRCGTVSGCRKSTTRRGP